MDYPTPDPDLWVLWSGNDHAWPDARRETWYLTDMKLHILKGFALFTYDSASAATFATKKDAQAFLQEHELRRPHPYSVRITTIRDLIAERFVDNREHTC